ncbi:grasp-with-spasm system ATP-grasp peptide maturase [Chryseobacterium phocaeense]|uniref:grasp-with-spasm system ATP-grasp peptide maturase n=1 Tax=Chryseobacterium phocaeense TaxID=1816690 RepID=UPI0009B9AF9D|nr:grasp-with-spasm system ATP-grasp peptide maturase [Chryseobacterium phocaeense]
MIFIQSAQNDSSTNNILDWILYLDIHKKIQRQNDIASLDKVSIHINKDVRIKGSTINTIFDSDEISRRWYRRGAFSFDEIALPKDHKTSHVSYPTQNYLKKEMDYILKLIDKNITHSQNRINTYSDNGTNKTDNLIVASQTGLRIPDTLITNEAEELLLFAQKHTKIITKAISSSNYELNLDDYKVHMHCATEMINIKDVDQKQNIKTSFPAFYQQYIEKKYELRIFYLKGKFYTMAIFSQANEKTKIDFRNYDTERPNRCVPYQLPKEIEEKLHHFMQSIDLNCGSIDMIYTPEKEYVFLEVNPVGQFQWLSKNCNYDIEREIALELIKER